MTNLEVKELCESRGLVYKGDFLETLSEEELNAGYMKFNIPDEDNIHSLNGEGVWGWMTKEDEELYNDDNYHGKAKAILCNDPLNYMGVLFWGCEVELVCHGDCRPTLSPEWIKEKLHPIMGK